MAKCSQVLRCRLIALPLLWLQLLPLLPLCALREECPQPPQIDFAFFETQVYMKGTILDCSCKHGYDRKEGTPLFIVCGGVSSRYSSWNGKCQCKRKSPPSQEEQNVTSAPEEQKDRTPTTKNRFQTYNPTSHCQEPVLWSHASETMSYQFVVGQKLQYQCLKTAKYGKTVESICKKIDGKPIWTKPDLKCTSVNPTETSVPSLIIAEDLISTSTETSVISSLTTEDKMSTSTETSMPSPFTTEYKIAVFAACVFLLSFIIFLVWSWRKRWRRRRQTNKEKTKTREVRSQQYCGKDHMTDYPIGLLDT
ncbi:interleukin-2 receptor subunit alpha [Antechinus flavipes]|uniref:interleukin-2 receptor subunit alpha n=1 Tax=Antechinus flavipes TaxID=38775 RepID=UPI0022358119|nr:interleukin-2 receptor subunit alpha [Antechinus flavipes]